MPIIPMVKDPIPENECIWILYVSKSNPEPRWRKIFPQSISFSYKHEDSKAQAWYLNAYDVDQKAFRAYKLVNIVDFSETR